MPIQELKPLPRHQLVPVSYVAETNRGYIIALQRDHHAELPRLHCIKRRCCESGGQHPIECGGGGEPPLIVWPSTVALVSTPPNSFSIIAANSLPTPPNLAWPYSSTGPPTSCLTPSDTTANAYFFSPYARLSFSTTVAVSMGFSGIKIASAQSPSP